MAVIGMVKLDRLPANLICGEPGSVVSHKILNRFSYIWLVLSNYFLDLSTWVPIRSLNIIWIKQHFWFSLKLIFLPVFLISVKGIPSSRYLSPKLRSHHRFYFYFFPLSNALLSMSFWHDFPNVHPSLCACPHLLCPRPMNYCLGHVSNFPTEFVAYPLALSPFSTQKSELFLKWNKYIY